MLEDTLDIPTADGAMPTFVCRPDRGGPLPAVFLLMDAPGIREELRDMARRMATVGYLVLLPNLYYRAGTDTYYGPDVLTAGSAEHARMRAVRTRMTIPPVMDDFAAMLAFVDARDEVRPGPVHSSSIGTVRSPPAAERSVTRASRTSSGAPVSIAGEAFITLPPIVPTLRVA